MKDKKGVSIVNAFQKILDDSKRKPNKIWVDKGSKFYNRSMKLWLEKNDIEIYSTHNEGKSVVAEKFIGAIKNKIYRYTRSISKNVYIDKLDDIVDEYNNTYHRTIKMKPIDVINDLNDEETIGTFYVKEFQKIDQQEFRIEKVIKKKGDKLYVKWKGYDNSFNSWIDKKDLV